MQYEGWELSEFDKATSFRKYQNELIKKYITGITAEVGPGNGASMEYYIKNTKRVYAYEPSLNIYKILKKNLKKRKKKIICIQKKFQIKKNFFNTIIYLDVIEHIKNHKNEIDKAYKSLKSGGHLIINLPAFQHLYSQFDRDVGHHRRYNKSILKKLFKNYDCSIKKILYYDTLGYLFILLSNTLKLNYKKNFKKKIQFWNTLIPISKIIDFFTNYCLGKSILIIIKKN